MHLETCVCMLLVVMLAFLQLTQSVGPWDPPDEIEAAVSNMTVEQLMEALNKTVFQKLNPILHKLVHQYGPNCSSGNSNQLLARTESHYVRHYTRTPPWTVAVEAIRFADTMKDLQHNGDVCHSLDLFLDSVASGSRLCPLNLLSPTAICNIFNQYSHVYLLGDSLTRHTVMALLSLVVSDLQFGSFPTQYERAKFKDCLCDGAYSEAKTCRSFDESTLAASFTRTCEELVPGGYDTVFHTVLRVADPIPGMGMNPRNQLKCNRPDNRPMLLFLQAGRSIHVADDHKLLLRPRLYQIYNYLKRCGNAISPEFARIFDNTSPHSPHGKRVQLAFTGGCVQHRRYDYVFPLQSREQFLLNNQAWKQLIEDTYPGAPFLDFHNLTMQPPTETSDGYHYLTATNIEKANTIVRLMGLLSRK